MSNNLDNFVAVYEHTRFYFQQHSRHYVESKHPNATILTFDEVAELDAKMKSSKVMVENSNMTDRECFALNGTLSPQRIESLLVALETYETEVNDKIQGLQDELAQEQRECMVYSRIAKDLKASLQIAIGHKTEIGGLLPEHFKDLCTDVSTTIEELENV